MYGVAKGCLVYDIGRKKVVRKERTVPIAKESTLCNEMKKEGRTLVLHTLKTA